MEAILILLTLLVTVSSRNIPSTDDLLTKDLLRDIFGDNSSSQKKTETVIDEPISKDVLYDIFYTNYTILPVKKNSSRKEIRVQPETVKFNININVDTDYDKGTVIDEVVKGNKNINSTGVGDGSKKVKAGTGNTVQVESRFDDRVAFEGGACAPGSARVGPAGPCVEGD